MYKKRRIAPRDEDPYRFIFNIIRRNYWERRLFEEGRAGKPKSPDAIIEYLERYLIIKYKNQ